MPGQSPVLTPKVRYLGCWELVYEEHATANLDISKTHPWKTAWSNSPLNEPTMAVPKKLLADQIRNLLVLSQCESMDCWE